MQGYDADENYFSDEGLDTNTEALMEKLEQAGDAASRRSRPEKNQEQKNQDTPSATQSAEDVPRRPRAPAGASIAPPGEGRYALLLAFLASVGAVAGALLFSYMRA